MCKKGHHAFNASPVTCEMLRYSEACIDLGNPKLEPSIHLIFHNADKDRASAHFQVLWHSRTAH